MGDDDTTNPWPEINPNRRAVWHRGLGRSEKNDEKNKKILLAFDNVKSLPLNSIIIQFWSPVTAIDGRRALSCSRNPFALSKANHRLWKYRTSCVKYYYSLNGSGDARTIIGGPPCTALRHHFPEVVLDLRAHQGTPMVDLALESELSCFMMLPVFKQSGSCIGVIEVSARLPPDLAIIFNELNRKLKIVGFSLTPPQSLCRPCKGVTGDSKSALCEIRMAVSLAVQSHAITLGHVWYPYENRCVRMPKSRTLLCRLASYGAVDNQDDDHLSFVKTFFGNFRVLPLIGRRGEGLIGRTLETHQPHLCRNIYKLSDNRGGPWALLSANVKSCACFVICLRSSHTGELDYAFEFFWPQTRNHLALMEGLLLTLSENLPSFKHVSGAQLGNELPVVDVDSSSSGSGTAERKPIKVVPGGNKLPKVVVTRASVAKRRKIAADLHNDAKVDDLHFSSPPLTIVNNNQDDDDDLVIIIAVYKVYNRLFFLPSSATFEDVTDKIKREFEHELNPADGTYKINYQVLPGMWHSLTDDTSLKSCVSSYQTSNNIEYIKLYVLPVVE
ncbi:hypothetical protein SSX86_001251 [Deinandra increscens subsp. villosa]|uniref:NLP1-9 GAF domain-containing protein n=1 Tax=Deinandra increscens subsp. villosa TaxID=3103831 RepID=A0AAP0DUM3_9ASTR